MSLLLAEGGAGSPVNYTLTCAAGSYTYTGQAATLQVIHSLVCATGAYVYTGQAATLQVHHSLTCDAGSYTYTGQAATLNVSHRLTCDAGVYTYVGNDATLTYVPGVSGINYTLACDTGSYLYSGIDAILLHSPGIVEQPSVGGGGGSGYLYSVTPVEYRKYLELEAKKKKLPPIVEKIEDELEDTRFAIEVDKLVGEIKEEIKAPKIDQSVIDNYTAKIEQLIAIYEEYKALQDEEEAIILLLLAA